MLQLSVFLWFKMTGMTKLIADIFYYFYYNVSMSDNNQLFPLDSNAVKRLLKSHNVTPTKQRVEIAGFLFQKDQHLSAENILDGVNFEDHKVSRATVYNTLGLFTKKGLVREVLIDRERVFFDSNNTPHHHIFNVSSGELPI